jgi:hypothetical protein
VNPVPPPGSSLLYYYGHGSTTFVGVHCTSPGGGVVMIDRPFVSTWMNPDELPLFVTATCDAGDFEFVDPNVFTAPYSLCEHALLAPSGGAIAALSNTSAVKTHEGISLGVGLMDGLFATGSLPPFLPGTVPEAEARRILGAVSYASFVQLFADYPATAADGLETSTILGDPALRLRIFEY